MATEEFRVRFTQDGAKEIIRSFEGMITSSESAEDAAAKLTKAVNEVRRAADPAQRAYDSLAKSINVATRAEQAGIISAGEKLRLQEKLTVAYQGSLRPVNSLISKINQETKAWDSTTAARQAALRTIGQVENLQRRGIQITDQERDAVMRANLAYAEKREQLSATAKAEKDASTAAATSAREQVAAAKAVERENNSLAESYKNLYAGSGTSVESALSRRRNALEQVEEAQKRGIITAKQAADIEGRLARQYAESVDPLQKIERLQLERVSYMSGLFQGGRQLATVNRDLTKLDAQGVVLDQARVKSLRAHAAQADKLQTAYEGLNRAKTLFGTVVGSIGLGFAAGEFTKSLDVVTTLNNRLALVSSSQANANRLFQENVKIAVETRQSLEGVIDLYSRLARSTQQFGYSQQDVLKLTKTVSQALVISGANAKEAQASLVQFGQALASNRLGGDELRSILEQAPRLASALVDGLNDLNKIKPEFAKALKKEIQSTGEISIGSLRKLGKEGVLTTKIVFDAISSQAGKLEEEFGKTTPTIAQSFEVLKTKWLSFLNDFNKGSGVAGALSKIILTVANNLEKVVTIASVIGGALAGAFIGNQIQKFVSFVASLPTAFSAAAQSVNGNTTALNNENIALARNTELQLANAAARNGMGGAAAGQAARGGAQAASAAGSVGSAAAAVSLQTGNQAAMAMRANLTGVGAAATSAAAKTGILAGGLRLAQGAAAGISSALGFLGVALAVVGALAAVWVAVKDKIELANDATLAYSEGGVVKAIKGTITLGDVAAGVWDTLTGKVDDLTQAQIDADKKKTDSGVKSAETLTDAQKKADQQRLDSAAKTAVETQSVYEQMNEGIAKSTANMVGDFVTGASYIGNAFVSTFKLIAAASSNVFNAVGSRIAKFYNSSVLPLLNKAKEYGIGSGGTAMDETNNQTDLSSLYIDLAKKNVTDAIAAGDKARERAARSIVSSAARRNRNTQVGDLTTNGAGNPPKTTDTNKAKKSKLASEYRQLRDELDPLAKITEDYTKDELTLNNAMAKGLATKEYGTELLRRLKVRYDEARDPIGKMVKDQAEENSILSLAQPLREAATQALEKERQLREKLGRTLTDEEKKRLSDLATQDVSVKRITEMTDALAESSRQRSIELGELGKTPQLIEAEAAARSTLGDALKNNVKGSQEAYAAEVKQNLAFINLRDAGKRVDEMYQNITEPQRTFAQQTLALNTLLAQGKISITKYNQELRGLEATVLQTSTSMESGFMRALINIKDQTEDAAGSIQTVFENAFSNIEDQFVSIFTDGKIDLASITKGLAGDLARTFFRQAIDPLISQLSTKVLGTAVDTTAAAASQTTIEATKTAIATQGIATRAALEQAAVAPAVAGATVTQTAVEAAKTGIATTAATSRAGLDIATTPVAVTAGTTQQTAVEAAKTGVTTAAVATRTGAELAGNAATAGVTAADLATHTAAEAAKTSATVAGVSARTTAEVTGAATTKGLTISSTLMSIGANAVKAATGAYAAIASIPFVGPILAPAAAAAALAGVYAIGKSVFSAQDGFGNVPYDGAMTELHKEEMVLPAKYANPLRDQLTDGSGGQQAAPDVNLDQKIVNVLDPQLMLDALQTTAGTRVLTNFVQSNPEVLRRALGQ